MCSVNLHSTFVVRYFTLIDLVIKLKLKKTTVIVMSELTSKLDKSVHRFTVAFEGISGYLCNNGEVERER